VPQAFGRPDGGGKETLRGGQGPGKESGLGEEGQIVANYDARVQQVLALGPAGGAVGQQRVAHVAFESHRHHDPRSRVSTLGGGRLAD
jgi:hypothetical protein